MFSTLYGIKPSCNSAIQAAAQAGSFAARAKRHALALPRVSCLVLNRCVLLVAFHRSRPWCTCMHVLRKTLLAQCHSSPVPLLPLLCEAGCSSTTSLVVPVRLRCSTVSYSQQVTKACAVAARAQLSTLVNAFEAGGEALFWPTTGITQQHRNADLLGRVVAAPTSGVELAAFSQAYTAGVRSMASAGLASLSTGLPL